MPFAHMALRLIDNGASIQIEDDVDDPLDVESNPLLPRVVDEDADADLAFDHFEHPDPADDFGTDDFDRLLDKHAAASVGADFRPVSDLTRLARVEEMEHEEAKSTAAYSRVNPPSAARGVLGGSAVARPAPNIANNGDLVNVVYWTGTDIEACPITVTLQPQPFVAQTGVLLRPVARIEWGTKNGLFLADVDMGTGVQLTLNASSAYVSIYLDAGSQNANLTVLGSIGFYAAKSTQMTKTSYLNQQAAGATTSINRPNFATSILALERADSTAQYTLNFRDCNTVLVGQRVVAASAYLTSPILLSNDVVTVDVVNNSAGAVTSRLVFGLF